MTPDAFHAALRDDPDDDLTRMVYADWLDDHAECDRAHFVRLAVKLERLPDDAPNRGQLLARYNDLRLTHGAAWLGPRPASLQDVGYRGGLASRLVFSPDATAADVETMLARHPASEVSIAGERTVQQLPHSPALALIRSLSVRQGMRKRRAHLLDRLLESPGLMGLRELSIAGDVVDSYLAQVIAESTALRGLHGLRLERTQMRESGVRYLLSPGALPNLRAWHVECQAQPATLGRLFSPANAARWQSLHWPGLRNCAPQHLDGLRACVNLRRLHVVFPPATGSGWVSDWLDGLDRLKELHLDGYFSPILAHDLADWSGLSRLSRLRVRAQWSAADNERIRRIVTESPRFNKATKFEQ